MTKKKQYQIAKTLLKASLKNESVDPSKVKIVLEKFAKMKIQGKASILKTYRRLVSQIIRNETLTIESPTSSIALKKFEKTLLAKTNAKKVIYKTNPQIVFGAKISHGDWIIDATLNAQLEKLKPII